MMWKVSFLAAVSAILAYVSLIEAGPTPITAPCPDQEENRARFEKLEKIVESLARQLIQQQTTVEERIRTEGTSGVVAVRHWWSGTKPYYHDIYTGKGALAAHDHADFDGTLGLGEFAAVMNGVIFRTRHNDYKLRCPAHYDKFHATEEIPSPGVPEEVLKKPNITEQVKEMREWFKAFKEQDHSVRDYRKFFKPNLCYLEGAWTLNTGKMDEPFDSDRHHIDASSWFDLQEKNRFSSYGGSKSNSENYAYLPTIVYNVTDGVPQYAQWNYRILCHQLSRDLPTSYFKEVDDLSKRLRAKTKWSAMRDQRFARFRINEYGYDRATQKTLIDDLMYEIPGKNNYGVNLTDDTFSLKAYQVDKDHEVLNAGHYHRMYRLRQEGAMGTSVNFRGFRDENLWVAMTTQPNVMPLSITACNEDNPKNCWSGTRRYSYAIPLEVAYTTPLQSWNPYNLLKQDKPFRVSRDGRNGGQDPSKAFNGTSFRHFYRTPVEFYQDPKPSFDAANTARPEVGVLDRDGNVKKMSASGFRIRSPEIEGVGRVRLRYPIFPAHYENSVAGIELEAVKEALMDMPKYTYLYEKNPKGPPKLAEVDYEFELYITYTPSLHTHELVLTAQEMKQLLANQTVKVTTSYNLGHEHDLELYYGKDMWGDPAVMYRTCDGLSYCWDKHRPALVNVGSV